MSPVDDETFEVDESYLSVPDLRRYLERRATIKVRFLDRDGNDAEEVKSGLTSRAVSGAEVDEPGRRSLRRSCRSPHARHLGPLQHPRRAKNWGAPPSHRRAVPVSELLVRDGLAAAESPEWAGGDCGGRGRPDWERRQRMLLCPARETRTQASTGLAVPGLADAHSARLPAALPRAPRRGRARDFWSCGARRCRRARRHQLDPDLYLPAHARAAYERDGALAASPASASSSCLHRHADGTPTTTRTPWAVP